MKNPTDTNFDAEFHRRIIVFHILGMQKWNASRVALYFFGNSHYDLATRMAQQLMDNPDSVSDFLRRFPISTARYAQITDALLRESLPNYRSLSLKPKMIREIPDFSWSIIK